MQRSQHFSSPHRRISGARLAAGALGIDEHERVQRRIERVDAVEMGVHELDR